MKKNIVFVILTIVVVTHVLSNTCDHFFYQNTTKTEVSNITVSNISRSSAKINYTIIGENLVEIGVCYGTGSHPTPSEKNKVVSYEGDAYNVQITLSYKERISKLEEGKEYYARAYVKNKAGKIFYSDEVFFKTEKANTDYSVLLNGPKKDFYPNGTVMKEYTLKDGQVEGNMKFYNEEGILVADEYIKDGIQNGTCKYYYSNGQLKTQVQLINGVQNGQLTEYDKDGALTTDSNLTGIPPEFNGVVKHFFKNGQISDVTNISGGELSSSVHYDIQGRVTSEQTQNGTIDYSYDRDGHKHTSVNGEKCTCSKCSENSNN